VKHEIAMEKICCLNYFIAIMMARTDIICTRRGFLRKQCEKLAMKTLKIIPSKIRVHLFYIMGISKHGICGNGRKTSKINYCICGIVRLQ